MNTVMGLVASSPDGVLGPEGFAELLNQLEFFQGKFAVFVEMGNGDFWTQVEVGSDKPEKKFCQFFLCV